MIRILQRIADQIIIEIDHALYNKLDSNAIVWCVIGFQFNWFVMLFNIELK
jgi:hypothetical protein